MIEITPLTDADAEGLLSLPDPDSSEAIAADLVVAGFTELVEADVPAIKSTIIDFFGNVGYRVRRSDVTPLGITDDGNRIMWLIVYMDKE